VKNKYWLNGKSLGNRYVKYFWLTLFFFVGVRGGISKKNILKGMGTMGIEKFLPAGRYICEYRKSTSKYVSVKPDKCFNF